MSQHPSIKKKQEEVRLSELSLKKYTAKNEKEKVMVKWNISHVL